jgi:hypothetical protein
MVQNLGSKHTTFAMSLGSPRLSSSASAYAFEYLSASTQLSDGSSALVMTPGAGISLLPSTLDWPSSPPGLLPLLDSDSASSLSASSSIASSASVSPVVMTSWYANSAATAAAMAAAAAAAAASSGLHSGTSLPGAKRPRMAVRRARASSIRETSESSDHEYDDDLEMGGSTGSGSGSDNPRSSSSSSSASPDPELAQHRARNRAAASRYRERKQSQRNSLECSVHALKQQVESSQQQAASAAKENQFLRSQLAFLTNLLSAHLPSALMMGGGDSKPHRSDSDSNHGFSFGFPGLPDATARQGGSSLLAVAFVFVLISLLPTAHVLGAYSTSLPSSSSSTPTVAAGAMHSNGFASTGAAHLAMSGHHYHAGARALLSINDADDESSAANTAIGASHGFEQPAPWSTWSLVVSVLARLLLVLSYASMACVLFVGASIALMNGSVRAVANRVGGAVRTLCARISNARGVCPKRQKSMA